MRDAPTQQDPSLQFREIEAADIPALFHVRTRTRENTYTLEQLQALGITPESVAHWLTGSCKGWLCSRADMVIGFCMADRASGELLVIAVLPEYEGQGVGGRLLGLAEEWLWQQGCTHAWLTTDLDTSLRAYGFYRRRGWTDWKLENGLRWMELIRPDRPVRQPPMTIIVRRIQIHDAPGYRACLDSVAREKRYLAQTEALPIERINEFVRESVDTDAIQFVALDGERIVGWADVFPHWAPALAHCGTLGMGVHADYRGFGIGARLLSACLQEAAGKGISRIELQARADNVRAIRLYERAGFVAEARLRKAMCFDGVYYEAIQMCLFR